MKALHSLLFVSTLTGLIGLLMASASADNASTESNLVARGCY